MARFANDLTDAERAKLTELVVAERKERVTGSDASCTTQLCAILTLLDRARANDESDFSLYLSAAVNTSDSLVAPERSQKRCRQLFIDAKVLEEGIERIQIKHELSGRPRSKEEELESGVLLHSAIQKM